MTNGISLDGKRALVTGGASGIGAVTAGILRELGATIAISDINADGLAAVSADLGDCPTLVCDVANEEQAELTVSGAAAALGGLDITVNAAGVVDEVKYALERDMEPWQRIMDVNFKGTYQICRASARLMVPKGAGAIVNIASVNGPGGWPRRTAYGPSKAAIIALTRELACEWGPHGVRINAVGPGYIATPMIQGLVDADKIDTDRINNRTPMGRLGTPAEVGQAIAFLASDFASFITGETLFVDGGWMAYGGAGDVKTF
ncbi:MAG: SDR family NAD(P)-dependent oxidoreductase [Alphaproteobacteria bacterium]|jgi:NAD(P)-dependent dehydrogenase (short-subunit alcohol dehydrogenase family)|nr:SDR family NAD(P)-dependent oxidoreductase [Alphaproteobacteria bacterium]